MSWTCPYCQHNSIVTSNNSGGNSYDTRMGGEHGPITIKWRTIVCLNEACNKITFSVFMLSAGSGEKIRSWQLLPDGAVKPFPDYIPLPILEDYKEAVLIRLLSPKASATLARRCLQGMIRDVWKVKPARLVDEIKSIEGHIDSGMWKAIDAVRNIGNIGAHMENDINVIVDVDPDEAEMLIGLLELLIQEWYVERHERQLRIEAITAIAAEKKELKKAK